MIRQWLCSMNANIHRQCVLDNFHYMATCWFLFSFTKLTQILTSFQISISPACAMMKLTVYFKTWLCASGLQSGLAWTAEEGAPPVTRDVPDVATTPHVKWPECLCHVKYVSGLSKQCIQYSAGRKHGGILIYLGSEIHLRAKSDLILLDQPVQYVTIAAEIVQKV